MSSENTKLWDILGRTDPNHTKGFTRGGGFKGTAIKPMWSYRRLTEQFGPCGTGWGVDAPSFQVVPGDNREVMVFCTVSGWYMHEDGRRTVYGVGGDKVVGYIKANEQYKRPERWENDDEAFKKAFTDALTNAFKLIGVGADVHMGLFDDSKYVASMREEFADDEKPASTSQRRSSASLKRDDVWAEFERELAETSGVTLTKFALAWSTKALQDGWPSAWKEQAAEAINKRRIELKNAVVPDDDEFPGDRPAGSYGDAKGRREQHPLEAG